MRKKFIVYNSEGQIVRSGECRTEDFSIQAGDGETVIEGSEQDVRRKKIVGGEVVDVPPEEDIEQQLRELWYLKRDPLLAATDWTQVEDAPLSDKKKSEWAAYRQALRDLPAVYKNAKSADEVEFPAPPSRDQNSTPP